jgi:hypothetical protein
MFCGLVGFGLECPYVLASICVSVEEWRMNYWNLHKFQIFLNQPFEVINEKVGNEAAGKIQNWWRRVKKDMFQTVSNVLLMCFMIWLVLVCL